MVKKVDIFPKNKEHFKKLIPFAQEIIKICRENKIDPIIYGSFSHFVHTKDKTMNVNDIDLIIPKKDLPKIANIFLAIMFLGIRAEPQRRRGAVLKDLCVTASLREN